MRGANKKYNEWCKKIADSRNAGELIAHFREHVSDHFDRYNRRDEASLKTWIVGVLNFMNIPEKKFTNITTEDKPFKLSAYYKNHKTGPPAPFDVDDFIGRYSGDIKKFETFEKFPAKPKVR